MEIWKPLRASHISTPPTAATASQLIRRLRYTNNPTGTKCRAGHSIQRNCNCKLTASALEHWKIEAATQDRPINNINPAPNLVADTDKSCTISKQ
jgi:hypothetical protein